MQCSKKSLFLLSVATIALFALLSQNSIAASTGGSALASIFGDSPQARSPTGTMLSNIQGSSAVPKIPAVPANTENSQYDMSPLIDPAKFSPEIRAKFDRLKATNPYMFQNVMDAANYGITLAEAVKIEEVLTGIKNPRARINFVNAVLAANPEYNHKIAAAREQIRKDLNNPKTQFGKLGAVTDLLRQADELDAAFKNLPAGGPSFWDRHIVVPIEKLFNNTPFMEVDAKRGIFMGDFERTLPGGKPTQAFIPDDMGYEGAHRVINGYRSSLLGEWIAALNYAHAITKNRLGMAVEEVPQGILANLVDRGFAIVKHGYVIPRITDQQYEKFFVRGEE